MDWDVIRRMEVACEIANKHSFDQDNICLDEESKGRHFAALYFEKMPPSFRFGELAWDRKQWTCYVPTAAECALFLPRKYHIWVVNHGVKETLFEGWMPEDEVAAMEDVYWLWVKQITGKSWF